ncbi:MAG: hypothetical protein BWZ00_00890 [Bacteroidetes bacterium ADurb.BinA174]|jgi:hypothetical protein|nr:MAG: hypothetical protein BWZ00_00890 [Bacteroidetes bacterium ADurb.BinA174]
MSSQEFQVLGFEFRNLKQITYNNIILFQEISANNWVAEYSSN